MNLESERSESEHSHFGLLCVLRLPLSISPAYRRGVTQSRTAPATTNSARSNLGGGCVLLNYSHDSSIIQGQAGLTMSDPCDTHF